MNVRASDAAVAAIPRPQVGFYGSCALAGVVGGACGFFAGLFVSSLVTSGTPWKALGAMIFFLAGGFTVGAAIGAGAAVRLRRAPHAAATTAWCLALVAGYAAVAILAPIKPVLALLPLVLLGFPVLGRKLALRFHERVAGTSL